MPEEIAAELVATVAADGRGTSRPGAHRDRRAGRGPSSAATVRSTPPTAEAGVCLRRVVAPPRRWTARTPGLVRPADRLHQAHPAALRGRRSQGLAISVPAPGARRRRPGVVISGGIDLSIGSMMALTSVSSAATDEGPERGDRGRRLVAVLLLGLGLGAINGGLVVVTRVPDIVVTLAMVIRLGRVRAAGPQYPGGGSAAWLKAIVERIARQRVDPEGGRRPGSRRRRRSGSPSDALALACRSTRSAATGWPPSEAACRSAGRRSSPMPSGPVRGARRSEPDCEHRDRNAGARALHAAQRRRRRPRRREPRRRAGAASSGRSSRFSSSR